MGEELQKRILELKNNIKALEFQIEKIYSRLDSIECYQRNSKKSDELHAEIEELEHEKSKSEKELYSIESTYDIRMRIIELDTDIKSYSSRLDPKSGFKISSQEFTTIVSQIAQMNKEKKSLEEELKNKIK